KVYDPAYDRAGRVDIHDSPLVTGVSGCPCPDHRGGSAGPDTGRRPRGTLRSARRADYVRHHRHACAHVVRSGRNARGDHAVSHPVRPARRAPDLFFLATISLTRLVTASYPHSFKIAL